MIVLEDVRADARLSTTEAPYALQGVRLNIFPGVTALVGARSDGGPLLLAVLAARVRVKKGRALLGGHAPEHAETRRQVAYVPLDATLPEALTAGEALDIAARIRGEAPRSSRERLAVLGIDHLERRRVSTLAREEARAVALAEALTSEARILLVEEPELANDPPAAARAMEKLRARAKTGAFVIVATGSARTAHALGGAVVRMAGGIATPVPAESALARKGGARVRVLTSNARAFVAQIAADSSATAFSTDGTLVSVRGPDRVLLAAAVQRAIITSGVDVDMIEPETAAIEELRANDAPPQSAGPATLPPTTAPPSTAPPATPEAHA